MSSKADGPDPSRGLGELFADATRDAPPSSFGLDDVTSTSARVTARRRRAAMGASTLGVVVLAAGVVTTVSLVGHTGGSQTSVAAGGTSSSAARPHQAKPFAIQQHSETPDTSYPVTLPKQGGTSTGDPGPRAGAPRPGCAKADRELATALAGELPAAPEDGALPVAGGCPAGGRGAMYRIDGSGGRGTVTVLLLPAGTREPAQPAGTSTASATAADGRVLLLRSRADFPGRGDALPAGSLRGIATRLAPRF